MDLSPEHCHGFLAPCIKVSILGFSEVGTQGMHCRNYLGE
jgi:hypothetical protein